MDNMKLWHSVAKTDPRHVKPITGKSYRGNSPAPYWIIQRATEEFGPIGIGWGVIVKNERFERLSDTDVLHVATVSVWYMLNGVRSETFDQMGGTKAAYMTKAGGMVIDEDAGKKSVTDAMVKCMSMIGFAGDIFSGRWDDSKYVEQVGQEFVEKEREAARQLWLDDTAMALEKCETREELESTWKDAKGVMKKEEDGDAYETLKPIMERVAAAIKAKNEAAT